MNDGDIGLPWGDPIPERIVEDMALTPKQIWPSGDGTPGPAREAAEIERLSGIIAQLTGREPWHLERDCPGGARVDRSSTDEDRPEKHVAEAQRWGYTPDPWAVEILRLRAELARAPNGWEQAAKFVEEQADVYGETAVPKSARPVAEATLQQVAKALRARADAERREPAP